MSESLLITVMTTLRPAPLDELRRFHQRGALRYLADRCESLEGYDAAVRRLERQYGEELPATLKHYSRLRIEQRLAQQEE